MKLFLTVLIVPVFMSDEDSISSVMVDIQNVVSLVTSDVDCLGLGLLRDPNSDWAFVSATCLGEGLAPSASPPWDAITVSDSCSGTIEYPCTARILKRERYFLELPVGTWMNKRLILGCFENVELGNWLDKVTT